jgi:signal transduction histidine kinase
LFLGQMTSLRAPPILLLTVLAILVLGAIALWDERREAAAALDDFAGDQAALARELASAISARLEAASPPRVDAGAVLGPAARAIEHPGTVVVFLRERGKREAAREAGLLTSSGQRVRVPALENALGTHQPWVRLSREEAASAGLPPRLAIAAFAPVGAGDDDVAVVATALRVRDRERRAIWRLILGFGLTSAFIGAFGLLAERKQKHELALARSLALAEAIQTRDERLVRADKLATLGALATGIAHEVSTPLGVIVGRVEQLLPRVAGDERATRSLAAITEQSERITGIVRAFLRLARGGTPTLERVAPSELAHVALELVEHRFAKAGVDLTSDVAADLPRVACDPKLFEQVLVNLLLNACDACTAGGHVELAVRAGTGERALFVVTDDGEGITPEVAARATEPFFTTKSEGSGTGLGLAIANEIVKHHHGDLRLLPREGVRGTVATVELASTGDSS